MTHSDSRPPISRAAARARSARAVAALVLVAAGVSAGVLPYLSVPGSRADEVTVSSNDLRDGWASSETTGALTPASAKSTSFGELFSAEVDGQVYAQPIVAGSTVIVATENDEVYGLNDTTGAIKWHVSLGAPWPVQAGHLCTDLTPDIGVTGTPVYDAAAGG